MAENAVVIGIGLAVIWQGFALWTRQKKLREEMKRLENDMNIEWQGPDISLKRKNYPHMKDDYREGIEDEKDNNRTKGNSHLAD